MNGQSGGLLELFLGRGLGAGLLAMLATVGCLADGGAEGQGGDCVWRRVHAPIVQSELTEGFIVQGGVIEAESWTATLFKGLLASDVRFKDVDFDSSAFVGAEFRNCVFESGEHLRFLKFVGAFFDHCSLVNISFSNVQLEGCRLEYCDLSEVMIRDSELSNMTLQQCSSRRLMFANCKIDTLRVLGGSIKEVELRDCCVDVLDMTKTRPSEVRFVGGVARYILFPDDASKEARISVADTKLIEPQIPLETAERIDLSAVVEGPDGLVVRQEVEGIRLGRSSGARRALLTEARGVYTVLRRRFEEYGRRDLADRMEHRVRICHRESRESWLRAGLDFVWGDQARGHYGTSYFVVLRSVAFVWLLFTAVYFLCGFGRFGWAVVFSTSTLGGALAAAEPRMVHPRNGIRVVQYSLDCTVFSFDQLLAFATRSIDLGNVAERFRLTPTRYVGVGVGRIIGAVESICGIVLAFNFVQAFLRSL